MTLISDFATAILTINRFDSGKMVKGVYTSGEITEIPNIQASVQPLRAFEYKNYPDLQRTSSAVKVFTDIELLTANDKVKKKADRFTWGGYQYEVIGVEDWTNTDLPHYKSLAIKVDTFEAKR